MRCSLGLLLCVCIGFGTSEGLECLACDTTNDGPDCYDHGTKHETCDTDAEYACGINVLYNKTADGEWKLSEIVRGCLDPDFEPCYEVSDDVSLCSRLCAGDNCNKFPAPPSPTSNEWGVIKLEE